MSSLEPVPIHEDGETGDRFVIYGSDEGIKVEVRYVGETLWMTQSQIAELYGRDVSVISRHINNIVEEEELGEEAYLHDMQLSTGGRRASLYNLDMVISVGYRVSSKQATMFRRWATDKLVRFASKGFVVDTARLKTPENSDRVAELREIIRDIRSDEANVYRELRSICAMCQDYDGSSSTWREFYMQTQAKLLWAVTSHTPAEIVQSRADASCDNMGLTNWPNQNIRKSDVATAKAYLANPEIQELNRLTVILLDIFEDQLAIGKLTLMAQATRLLDQQLANLNRSVLNHGGRVSHETAKNHAEKEYEKYKMKMKQRRHEQADEVIRAIKETVRKLPKPKKR